MPKKKLTRERLRKIIAEEKAKLRKEKQLNEITRDLGEELRKLKANLSGVRPGEFASKARAVLTDEGVQKFAKKVGHTNAQINQAEDLYQQEQ